MICFNQHAYTCKFTVSVTDLQKIFFQYRIEGSARGRWGGIWRAPSIYSVASEDETQNNIEEVTKFDTYEYNDGGSVGFRVPWVFSESPYALLTTSPR